MSQAAKHGAWPLGSPPGHRRGKLGAEHKPSCEALGLAGRRLGLLAQMEQIE